MTLPPKRCPECGEEFVHTVAVCPECGVALVLELVAEPGRELPPSSALRCVRMATASWARSFSERLAAAGIAHRVELESDPSAPARAARGEALFGVYVELENLADAARLDAEHLRAQIPDVPDDFAVASSEDQCPACGERADLAAPECPSCGLAFRDAE